MSIKIEEELQMIRTSIGFQKHILTFDEFCAYAGISKKYGYYLTANNIIKFYRPLGKLIFFKREEVEEFLSANAVEPQKQIDNKVNQHLLKEIIA
jgi:excisionase family DNA binding protein